MQKRFFVDVYQSLCAQTLPFEMHKTNILLYKRAVALRLFFSLFCKSFVFYS